MKERAVLFGMLIMLAVAAPAAASSITITVGDKDGFSFGLGHGQQLPCFPNALTSCIAPIHDWRSPGEKTAANGAQLTDTYSALYDGAESDCGAGNGACSMNGPTGVVIFPFVGQLTSASLSILMADFETTESGAMLATINDVPLFFGYDHGFREIALETIVLTPGMLAAANAVGEVRLFLDHRSGFADGRFFGSFDYIAFDYFELQAEVVPEPGTWVLLGTGVLALAVSLRRSRRI